MEIMAPPSWWIPRLWVTNQHALLALSCSTFDSCGNGLLTHILVSEGYGGTGIDLRPRTSWSHYPPSTQACLHVHAFDPTAALSTTALMTSNGTFVQSLGHYLKPGTFLIGNHADELTPWVPVLSTLHSLSGYINIPCCAWSFDAKYERSRTSLYPLPPKIGKSPDEFIQSLNMGAEGWGGSSYSMYRSWLASMSLHCGWEVECEVLRIPSTRNWAVVGG
jgi:tRNASer (uridine44-2'-O)-methyltransferase